MVAATLSILFLAQASPANYDEAKVPPYTLPDVLAGGKSPAEWKTRRAEVFQLFEREMYGRSGPKPSGVKFEPMGWTVAVSRQITP